MPIILITGCMKSGKSKFLIKKYWNLMIKQEKILMAFQPTKNTRDDGVIRSDGTKKLIGAVKVEKATDILKYDKVDVFFIDELQMYEPEDLHKTLQELNKKGKTVYIAGLDYDYRGIEFKTYAKIKNQSYITKKIILEADRCSAPNCSCKGTMTILKRLGQATDNIESSINKYYPVCMHHFINGID